MIIPIAPTRITWSLVSIYPYLFRLAISLLCCAFALWSWGSGLVSSPNLNSIRWTSYWFGFNFLSLASYWKFGLRVVTREEHTVLGRNRMASGREEAFQAWVTGLHATAREQIKPTCNQTHNQNHTDETRHCLHQYLKNWSARRLVQTVRDDQGKNQVAAQQLLTLTKHQRRHWSTCRWGPQLHHSKRPCWSLPVGAPALGHPQISGVKRMEKLCRQLRHQHG